MALVERITNDYADWTQEDSLWVLSDEGSKAKLVNVSIDTRSDEIRKSFTLTRGATSGVLTVKLRRYKAPSPRYLTWSAGSASTDIYLKKPDGVNVLLYHGVGGDGSLKTVLDAVDISDHITDSGIYRLRFVATVNPARRHDRTDWEASYAIFEDVSLEVDSAVLWELDLDEDVSVVDTFIEGFTFLEDVSVKEYFTLGKTTPYEATDKKLLCAKTDSKVYEFDIGTPDGIFDIKDEDFGLPGQEKTLSEIHFSSSAEAPHTVTVSVSTDAGLTWAECGVQVISKGTRGIIFVWITEEAFSVRFQGAGLQLDSYTLYAIPRGQEAPVIV